MTLLALRGAAAQARTAMRCTHPVEELRPVYEGRAVARDDRVLCGLCGDLIYEPAVVTRGIRRPRPSTWRQSRPPSGR
ncbi:MAG: hypothetical protein Kow0010_24340 [Dehalococcoidia bacterium]